MKTETCKLYSRVSWIFLPNIIKIDLYNFELYSFKVGSFLRHSVVALCKLWIDISLETRTSSPASQIHLADPHQHHCIQSMQTTVLSVRTEDSRHPIRATTLFLHVSNPPSSRVPLPSLVLFHHSRSILPTGINPKTSSTYHLQWHPWHVISQRLICC